MHGRGPAALRPGRGRDHRTTQGRPEFFDLNDKVCENCYKVKNVSGYVAEVQRQLAAQGICSYYDGEELAVKSTNDFSEQYDILLASGHMRRGPGSYRGSLPTGLVLGRARPAGRQKAAG